MKNITIRALNKDDLNAVVAIDSAIEGHSRRGYIERRLAAALREPELHLQLAATDTQGLAGYLLARILVGEFGRPRPALRLEIIGVRPDVRGGGIGAQLLQALSDPCRKRGLSAIQTAASWRDHDMLRWFDSMGFALAIDRWIECAVDGGAYQAQRDAEASRFAIESPSSEVNYGATAANDFEKLARDGADVQSMKPQDLQAIVRIDQAITGRERSTYIQAQLNEAMSDSAVRVSLTAKVNDSIVGYLMARADIGDFGRTEPAAVIDTIGVDPAFTQHGIGRALLSQLFVNLGALRVERVETLLAPSDQLLQRFLFGAGFKPAQRLAFTRTLTP